MKLREVRKLKCTTSRKISSPKKKITGKKRWTKKQNRCHGWWGV